MYRLNYFTLSSAKEFTHQGGHVRLMGHFQVAVSLGFEVSLGAQLL